MNLIYLIFAPNSACCEVTSEKPKLVIVNDEEGTWTMEETSPRFKPMKIGEDHCPGNIVVRGGAIGVYDRDNVTHLSRMVGHVLTCFRDD